METRASHLLVGTVVLALLVAAAGFTVWLVRAGGDQASDIYEIAFEGSVTGLSEGGQVRYRGIPVGRVAELAIDPKNVEQILARVEIEAGTPITEDTVATLELQGITGIAFVQLRGGTRDSQRLEPRFGSPPPRIASNPSALEQVFESTPELLARTLKLAERVTLLFDDNNLDALGTTFANVEELTTALAAQSGNVEALFTAATGAVGEVETISGEMTQLAGDLRTLTQGLETEIESVGGDLATTLEELRFAASSLGGAARQLDQLIGTLQEPVDDFAGSGLYEFTQLMGETRVLVAALTRITTEFERDPAGFFLGSSQRGFEIE